MTTTTQSRAERLARELAAFPLEGCQGEAARAALAERAGQRLTLPYPPSVNRIWRCAGRGVVLSAEAKAYQAEAGWLARLANLTCHEGPTALTLDFYRPRRTGDVSNRVKFIEDVLNGVAYADDAQNCELHIYRADDRANPRVEVTVEAAA